MTKKISSAFSLVEISIVVLIIGIIAAGISSGAGMMYDYNLKTARALSKSSEVTLYPGLVLWLDATAENSVTNASDSYKVENGNTIKTWIDQNQQSVQNNRFIFTEKASSEGPIFLEKGINNLPTLYFNFVAGGTVTGDGLFTPYSQQLNPSEFTIFVVTLANENTANWETIFMSRDNNSSSTWRGFNLYKKNDETKFTFWTGTGALWTTTTDTTTFSFNTPYILTSVRTGVTSSDNSILYRNGTQTAISTGAVFAPNNSSSEPSAQFYLGYYPGIGASAQGYYYDGNISEVIMYNRALKDHERKSIERYLSQKYKINLS